MSRVSKVVVTTADTKEVIEYPGSDTEQVWEVAIFVDCVDKNGHSYAASYRHRPSTSIYVRRQTLIDAGILPAVHGDEPPAVAPTEENAEQLLLKLLALVGVNPSE